MNSELRLDERCSLRCLLGDRDLERDLRRERDLERDLLRDRERDLRLERERDLPRLRLLPSPWLFGCLGLGDRERERRPVGVRGRPPPLPSSPWTRGDGVRELRSDPWEDRAGEYSGEIGERERERDVRTRFSAIRSISASLLAVRSASRRKEGDTSADGRGPPLRGIGEYGGATGS